MGTRLDRTQTPIVPTARLRHLCESTRPRSELLGYFRAAPVGAFLGTVFDSSMVVPHSGQVPD